MTKIELNEQEKRALVETIKFHKLHLDAAIPKLNLLKERTIEHVRALEDIEKKLGVKQ